MTQHFRHKMLFMTNFVLNMTLYFCHTKPFFVVNLEMAQMHISFSISPRLVIYMPTHQKETHNELIYPNVS
jgi:hypothetical protein